MCRLPSERAGRPDLRANAGEMVEVPGRVIDPEGSLSRGRAYGAPGPTREPPLPTRPAGRTAGLSCGCRASRRNRCQTGRYDAPLDCRYGSGVRARLGPESSRPLPGEPTVRLVADGPPIEGRIIDLEGRPVAGAQVKVDRLWFAREASCRDRLRAGPRIAASQGPWDGLSVANDDRRPPTGPTAGSV